MYNWPVRNVQDRKIHSTLSRMAMNHINKSYSNCAHYLDKIYDNHHNLISLCQYLNVLTRYMHAGNIKTQMYINNQFKLMKYIKMCFILGYS